MKCLILAAGYATRLYPLTENFPKPLLKVGGKTILDWLTDDLAALGKVQEYIIVSNHRYAHFFSQWADERKELSVIVLDDGSDCNENRLGAVRDIQFSVERCQVDDDMLVIAGDNVLDFSLGDFISYAHEKGTTCAMRYFEHDEKRLSRSGVAEVDERDLILSMEEKPAHPRAHWCVPPFYYYIREDVKRIARGVGQDCAKDAPGSLLAWMCGQSSVHAMEMPGRRYDIGDLKSYQKVCCEYHGIIKA